MKKNLFSFILLITLSTIALLTTNGCHGVVFQNTIANAQYKTTQIKIGVLNSSNNSFDSILLEDFLSAYSFKYKIITYESYDNLIEAFKKTNVDFIIANTAIHGFQYRALNGPAYQDIKVALYCQNPQNINKVYLPHQFAFAEVEFLATHPELKDKVIKIDADSKTLINETYQIKNTCFMSDFNLETDRTTQTKKFTLSWVSNLSYPTAWFVQTNRSDINDLIHLWFQNLVRENKIAFLREQYESKFFKMSNHHYEKFRADIREILPQWKALFEEYAKIYGIPWTLLAAVAYQESKWDNSAESPTGVKGFMQITAKTAEHLGIQNRLDPIQSIQGGAYYLKYLFDKTSLDVSTEKRWIQALAAYNMGQAHIREIHKLAKLINKDPYKWSDFKFLLLEKENENNLEFFDYGLARGKETVNFIQKVILYNDSLKRLFPHASHVSLYTAKN